MILRSRLLGAAFALLFAGGILGGAQPFRYAREVKVASPGWVRLLLPLDVLKRLPPGEQGYELVDPTGRAVALFPWNPPPPPPPWSAIIQLSNARKVPGGWRVEADLEPNPRRHRRILLDIPGMGIAERVTLEGSRDGKDWHTLARGSLFRLSYSGQVEKTYLEYSPTHDRFLRLFWPEAAGFPRWREVRLEDWLDSTDGGAWLEDSVGFTATASPSGGSRWRFNLPQDWDEVGALLLEAKPASPVNASLLAASGGAWEARSETVLLPGSPCILTMPPGSYPGGPVLSFDAGEFPAPTLTAVHLRHPARYLLFMAHHAGTYQLLYGTAGVSTPHAGGYPFPEAPEKVKEANLGPEVVMALPDLPSASLAGGATLPEAAFAYRQAVQGPQAQPLKLVRLDIPPEVYGVARGDLADLRIGWHGHQVPYVLGAPPDGTAAATLRGRDPAPISQGRSALDFDLPAAGLPLTALELTAPSAPFTRGITVGYYSRIRRPGSPEREEWTSVAAGVWACPGVSDLPARFRLAVGPIPGRRLRVTFVDHDNAPLHGVEAVLWRRRHVVVFPWPGEGPVELLAGLPDLPAPVYDLTALKEDLLARPTLQAFVPTARTVPSEKVEDSNPKYPDWLRYRGKWVLFGVLGLASGALLLILGRTIRHSDGSAPNAP